MNLADLLVLTRAKERCADGRARQLRIAAGLTQSQVGGHCGVTSTAVHHWETGFRSPRGQPAVKYAKLLEALEARPAGAEPKVVAS